MKLTFNKFMLCLSAFFLIICCNNKEKPKEVRQDNRTEKTEEQLNIDALYDNKYQKVNALLISVTTSRYNTNDSGFDNKKLEDRKKFKLLLVDQINSFNKVEIQGSKDDMNPLECLRCNYHIQYGIGNSRKGNQVIPHVKNYEI